MTTTRTVPLARIALLVGGLCFATGDLLRRTVDASTGSPTELMAAVADHGTVWLAAGTLFVLSSVVMLPGAVWIWQSARARGRRLTRVGAGMLVLGLLAGVGHAAAYFGLPAVGVEAGLRPATYDAVDRASEHSPLLIGLIVAFILGQVVGVLVLFIGLRRAGRVPVWSLVACVVFVATANMPGVAAGVVGLLMTVAMYAPLCSAGRAGEGYSPVERQGLRRSAAT